MNRQRIEPGPGQESVWDYPRPPRVEPSSKTVKVVFNGQVVAETTNAKRVLETSHPPAYYIPWEDVNPAYFTSTPRGTFCEFKGRASYFTIEVNGKSAQNAAWTYKNPTPAFELIKDHIALYPAMMDACYVDDEEVQAQEGDFYGGWITSDIVGPFKGGPGTWGW
ncbi:MAG: DUF427 domain-containing protein [Chloroflexota bacterium]